jgi:hypothetical protein
MKTYTSDDNGSIHSLSARDMTEEDTRIKSNTTITVAHYGHKPFWRIYTNPNWLQRIWQKMFPLKIKMKKDPRCEGIPEDIARDLAEMMVFDTTRGLVSYPQNMSQRLIDAGVAYWEANEGIEYTIRNVTGKS